MKKKTKTPFDSIRKPIPKPGKFMTTKKGKKGYDRKKDNKHLEYPIQDADKTGQ